MSSIAADGPIRHVVHFKFKSDTTPAQIQKITEEFAALKTKISEVDSLEWGKNVSPEGLSKGFDYCWIVTFKNTQDRDVDLCTRRTRPSSKFSNRSSTTRSSSISRRRSRGA